jgi:general secretion pathway protein M
MKKINLSYLKSLPSNLSSLKSIQLPFNLQQREKIALAIAGIALAVFLVFRLTLFPIIDSRAGLHKRIQTQTAAMAEMQTLKAEYETLTHFSRNMQQQLKRRSKTFTLFSFMDRLAGQSGLKQNIVYMKPSNSNLKNSPYSLSMVEIKMSALTMLQLTTFLHGIEDPTKMVWVKRLSISKDDKKEGLINSVLQVETLQQ